jgi:hypothetical protein
MYATRGRRAKVLGAVFVLPLGVIWAGGDVAGASSDATSASVFTAHIVLSGSTLSHTFTPQGGTMSTTEALTDPDDITLLGNDIFVGPQNGTGSTNDAVDAIRGRFVPGQPMVAATPCGANSAPATCPAPPSYPANYMATLNPFTGQVPAVTVLGAAYVPPRRLALHPSGRQPQY